jgi:hypothetical protein
MGEVPSEKSHQRRTLAQPDKVKRTTRKRITALRAEFFISPSVRAAYRREYTVKIPANGHAFGLMLRS